MQRAASYVQLSVTLKPSPLVLMHLVLLALVLLMRIRMRMVPSLLLLWVPILSVMFHDKSWMMPPGGSGRNHVRRHRHDHDECIECHHTSRGQHPCHGQCRNQRSSAFCRLMKSV